MPINHPPKKKEKKARTEKNTSISKFSPPREGLKRRQEIMKPLFTMSTPFSLRKT